MHLLLDEEHKMLQKQAKEFLGKECPKSLIRELEESELGYSPELWQKMSEIGWLGILLPEQYGGVKGDKGDLVMAAVVIEEMGYAALLSPFFPTVVLSGLLILEIGSEEQKRQFLPQIAQGSLIMTHAFTEVNAHYDASGVTVKAVQEGDNYIINGVKLFCPYANSADWLICAARTSDGDLAEKGISLFLAQAKDRSIKYELLQTTAGDKQYAVVFENVRIPRTQLLGELNEGWYPLNRIIQQTTALKCAEMVGGSQAALDIALTYAKIRIQYDKPIGSFQAVHHHFADIYRDIQVSRLLTYQAAWKFNQGESALKEASMAKAKLNSAYPAITRLAHQIYGGVGYYTDCDLQIYYRRAVADMVAFGDKNYHLELIARELL